MRNTAGNKRGCRSRAWSLFTNRIVQCSTDIVNNNLKWPNFAIKYIGNLQNLLYSTKIRMFYHFFMWSSIPMKKKPQQLFLLCITTKAIIKCLRFWAHMVNLILFYIMRSWSDITICIFWSMIRFFLQEVSSCLRWHRELYCAKVAASVKRQKMFTIISVFVFILIGNHL